MSNFYHEGSAAAPATFSNHARLVRDTTNNKAAFISTLLSVFYLLPGVVLLCVVW